MKTRDFLVVYINGKRHEISAEHAFTSLSDYLRYVKSLTGTKVVCAEGDCGACTVLIGRAIESDTHLHYKSVNSCITFMHLLDCCHIITVEGLQDGENLHPVQEAMIEHHGAQCGYCTPGIVSAIAGMVEDVCVSKKQITEKKAKNYLTGNLCRCTGYKPIIDAATNLNLEGFVTLKDRYHSDKMMTEFKECLNVSVKIDQKDSSINLPTTLEEACASMEKDSSQKINSGGTDIGVQVNKDRYSFKRVLSLNNVKNMYDIEDNDKALTIGAKVSLDQLEKAALKSFPEFSNKLHIFASPQIKNKGTVVGNIANASPIGDSIPFLMVAETQLNLTSSKGSRVVNLNSFYTGYKTLDLRDGELISSISVPKTEDNFKLYKVSIRKDLDISAVTFAAKYKIENGKISKFSLALGGVGATVLRMDELEKDLTGADWKRENFFKAGAKLDSLITPMSDVRGTKEYRMRVSKNLLIKFYDEVSREIEQGIVSEVTL